MEAVGLRRIDPSKNMARFYTIDIQPTLFGDWAVVRSWGRIGGKGRSNETWFPAAPPALGCLEKQAAAKRGRGYRDWAC